MTTDEQIKPDGWYWEQGLTCGQLRRAMDAEIARRAARKNRKPRTRPEKPSTGSSE